MKHWIIAPDGREVAMIFGLPHRDVIAALQRQGFGLIKG